ncbi:MAG: hypothetical protein ACYDHN_12840 [Solirubrobacteraceae bacterium]
MVRRGDGPGGFRSMGDRAEWGAAEATPQTRSVRIPEPLQQVLF